MAKAAAALGHRDADVALAGSCSIWPARRAGRRRDRAGRMNRTAGAELGRVHFVGIGGAGMSGIARILLARGVPVSGSDARESATSAALRAAGATVHIGHDAANVGRRRHGGRLDRDPGRQPRGGRGARGAGCGCCAGRRRWPR